MPRIFSVDVAVNDNRPYIEFRDRLWPLRDLTVAERLTRLVEFKEAQEARAAEIAEAGEELTFAHVQGICAQALMEALEDVPEEVAMSITEMEFEAFQAAVKAARESMFPAAVRNASEEDLERIGRVVG